MTSDITDFVATEARTAGHTIRINGKGEPCRGRVVPAIPPVNMTIISDKIACGKRGGANFLNTVQVDRLTNSCP